MYIIVGLDEFATIVSSKDEAESKYGNNWKKVSPPPSELHKWNGKEWIMPPDKRTWVEKRVEAYGPVSEQLGMIYDDKVNGTSNWVKHVQNAKKQHPKPQEKK